MSTPAATTAAFTERRWLFRLSALAVVAAAVFVQQCYTNTSTDSTDDEAHHKASSHTSDLPGDDAIHQPGNNDLRIHSAARDDERGDTPSSSLGEHDAFHPSPSPPSPSRPGVVAVKTAAHTHDGADDNGATRRVEVVAVSSCSGTQAAAALDRILSEREDVTALWTLRCLTRNPDSPSVRHLEALGVNIITSTHTSTGSPPSTAMLDQLLGGATALFLVTYSSFGSPDGELQEARAWGEAAVQHGVRVVVFSGGPRSGIAPLDAKADVEDHLRTLPLARAIFVHSSFFFENLVAKGGEPRLAACSLRDDAARRGGARHDRHVVDQSVDASDGDNEGASSGRDSAVVASVTFTNPLPPDLPVVMHSAADIGVAAAIAILQPARFRSGQQVRVVGSRCTPSQFARAFTDATGADATYSQMELSVLERAVFPDDPAAGAAVSVMSS